MHSCLRYLIKIVEKSNVRIQDGLWSEILEIIPWSMGIPSKIKPMQFTQLCILQFMNCFPYNAVFSHPDVMLCNVGSLEKMQYRFAFVLHWALNFPSSIQLLLNTATHFRVFGFLRSYHAAYSRWMKWVTPLTVRERL